MAAPPVAWRASIDDDQRFDVLIDELVHASLVVADTSGSVDALPAARERAAIRAWSTSRPAAGATPHSIASPMRRCSVLARRCAARRPRGAPSSCTTCCVRYDDLAEALRWCNRHDTDPQRAWRLCACMWAVVHQGRADDVVMVGRQTIERWPFDGSSVAGAAVATVATAEYVSGEPERAIALAESTLSGLAAPSLAAVTLQRVLGQARRAVGDVQGALAAFTRRRRAGQSSWTCRRWRSSSTSPTHRCRPTTDTSRRRCRRCARASTSRSASGRSSTRRGPARAWAGSCSESIPPSALEEIERALESSRRMTTTGEQIDYPIGVAVNLRSRAFAELLRGDVDAARATIAELLDDVLERGAISHARLVDRRCGRARPSDR